MIVCDLETSRFQLRPARARQDQDHRRAGIDPRPHREARALQHTLQLLAARILRRGDDDDPDLTLFRHAFPRPTRVVHCARIGREGMRLSLEEARERAGYG